MRTAARAGSTAAPVYLMEGRLYVNLTSRCALRCRFCFKLQDRPDFFGHQLLMARDAEPPLELVDRSIREAPAHQELVFCGLGEPLERWRDVAELATRYKQRGGGRVRVNTSGVTAQPLSRAELQRLATCVDCVAISLNAPDPDSYRELCQPARPDAYGELRAFIETARGLFPTVVLTAVSCPGVDLERCRQVARDLGLPFGVRPYSLREEDAGSRPPTASFQNGTP